MSKARPTAYQKFYWSDYFGDTYDLDGIQSGAYLHLIGWSWMKGQAPLDDNALLARITKLTMEQWLSVRPALEPFFVISSGLWRHTRIMHDLVEAAKAHEKAVFASKRANDKRWGQDKETAQDSVKQVSGSDANRIPTGVRIGSQPKPEPTPEPIKKEKTLAPAALALDGFDDFWSAYSRRDSRRNAEKAWPSALKKVGGDPSVIVQAAKAYSRQFITGAKSKEFQAMPASWLNGERWTDSSLLKIETPEHSEPTQAEVFAAAAAQIGDNPVSLIPSWFKGD